MYKVLLLRDEDFNPVFTTFYKKLQRYRDTYLLTGNFDDLSRTEIEILLCVANDDFPSNAKWIAKYLSVSKALVSQNIDSLVSEGYLERAVDPHDKRWHILTLGKKSEHFADEMMALIHNYNKTINKGISDEELEWFAKVLTKITKNLDQATQEIEEKLKK